MIVPQKMFNRMANPTLANKVCLQHLFYLTIAISKMFFLICNYVCAYYEDNDYSIMNPMINGSGPMDDELGTEKETQQDELSIDESHLFGIDADPMDDATQ
jgi:hypothetical protein